ncbi:hypothetical protein MJO29_008413 [Puccinia striiformis f. sp. tritici]|uniref:hypothetical protein n=1 Tax=Puccinia striiformis f. sp. tritici TaxID=168172 RepID=UPI002007D96B|nr:hypothetical protein Pst134EA_015415 [Puccinia striiformis f. sp. tritici]KAH9463331.1 hypothetical protein Pst134EA_015415 [Puccinia striiformis f. sp. tritici]KAI7952782.1 hypothetical protein MJO29_008413 [Puccinia striiformis f. sp. tritici]KAI9602845.1 hypothetical protein H4Q26_002151 [Puccinia striiformis f. sp. tritici PST-130]
MKAKAIEIRWHNTKPIYSTDFQSIPPSNLNSLIPTKSHPYLQSESDKQLQQREIENGAGHVWRLATAGGDNLVMMWLVYPRPTIAQVNQHRNAYQSTGQPTPPTLDPKSILDHKHSHPPIVEYLATLTKHQGVVNVVRFCPRAEMLASAGDDGNVLLWVLSTNPTPAGFGESAADKAYERESWRTRLMLRGPAQCEIYDLAWSPCGDFLLTGDTAKTARIWNVTDGSCIKQIAEHSNFVQGVAWDPLGEYIATQSSDRSMNVYSVQLNKDESGGATADVHHIAKNYKIDLYNQQTNSWTHLQNLHHEREDINPSSARSLATSTSIDTRSDTSAPTSIASAQTPKPKLPPRTASNTSNVPESPSRQSSHSRVLSVPPTPTTATRTLFNNDDSSMQPPTEIPNHTSFSTPHVRHKSNSRQSSVVSSSHPMSPSIRAIRSPSPVPPLPAIHVNEERRSSSVLLYGDEGASAFFRRLTWSNDGSTLITPAGRWENRFTESEIDRKSNNGKGKAKEVERGGASGGETSSKKRRRKRTTTNDLIIESDDEADQTGHIGGGHEPSGKENPTVFIYGRGTIDASQTGKINACQPLARLPGHKSSSVAIRFSPVFYRLKKTLKKSSLMTRSSKRSTESVIHHIQLDHGSPMQEIDLNKPSSSSIRLDQDHQSSLSGAQDSVGILDLPYRMIYAVATHDTVYIYDTQQSTPICLFNNLHFSSFTDLSWTNDGETLVLSSSDGYCSLVIFDKDELGDRLSDEELRVNLPSKVIRSIDNSNDNKEDNNKRNDGQGSLKIVVDNPGESINRDLQNSNHQSESTTLLPKSNLDSTTNTTTIDKDQGPQKKKKRVALTFEGPVKG